MTPSNPNSSRNRSRVIRGESVAGRSSSKAGTSTCAVIMNATSASIAARNGTNSTRRTGVAAAAGHAHRGPLGERRAEARNTSAFLVHAHPRGCVSGQRLEVVRQLRHLFGPLDVAREEDDPAELELLRERADFGC